MESTVQTSVSRGVTLGNTVCSNSWTRPPVIDADVTFDLSMKPNATPALNKTTICFMSLFFNRKLINVHVAYQVWKGLCQGSCIKPRSLAPNTHDTGLSWRGRVAQELAVVVPEKEEHMYELHVITQWCCCCCLYVCDVRTEWESEHWDDDETERREATERKLRQPHWLTRYYKGKMFTINN